MEDRPKLYPFDYSKLVELTKHCELFKKLNDEQGNDKIHVACCKAMKIETHNIGHIIVRYGDMSNDFYVVIEGKVGVRIPSNLQKNPQRLENTPEKPSKVENLKNSPKLKPDFHDRKIDPTHMQKFLGFQKEPMDEVSILGPGEIFGELAIISDKPRAATLVAKTKVVLGVLSKESFQRLIGSFTEKKMNEKIEFLQNLPIFKTWTKIFLQKVSFYFSLKKMQWRQILYKEGSQSFDLYFIKEGDIMVRII